MVAKRYKILLSPIFIDEVEKIYFYISRELHEENIAKKVIKNIKDKIQLLQTSPYIYAKLEDKHKLKKVHRKIVIGNYVVIYTVDDTKRQVNIVHIYYKGENYLEKI